MRLVADITPDGALIAAVVRCGEQLCAKSEGGPLFLRVGAVVPDLEPPRELPPVELPPPRIQA